LWPLASNQAAHDVLSSAEETSMSTTEHDTLAETVGPAHQEHDGMPGYRARQREAARLSQRRRPRMAPPARPQRKGVLDMVLVGQLAVLTFVWLLGPRRA
jgi:hypothetical protein